MLYEVYRVLRYKVEPNKLETNSFAKAKEHYLALVMDKKFHGYTGNIIMRCGLNVINRFDLSDPTWPLEVRSHV